MALGYDNNKNQVKRPTVNSPYAFANPMSLVDPTRLSASFWNRMLKLTITPRANTGNSEEITWEKDQNIAVHLTHIKASMLANEIREFLKDPISYNSSGVLSNETLITISNGSEFGAIGTFFVIRKIKPDTMETVSSYSYEFNKNFHHSIRNYNEEDVSFEKNFSDYELLEITQMLVLLENYIAAITNAIAYTVMDQMDYRLNRTDDMIKGCASALGVDVTSGGGGYSKNNTRRIPKSNNSTFANGGGTRTLTLDDAEGEIFGS